MFKFEILNFNVHFKIRLAMLPSLEGRLKSTGKTMLDIVSEANHYDDPSLSSFDPSSNNARDFARGDPHLELLPGTRQQEGRERKRLRQDDRRRSVAPSNAIRDNGVAFRKCPLPASITSGQAR